MKVEFQHTIRESEAHGGHINLRDDEGKSHGGQFPPAKARILVVDQDGREFPNRMHNRTQIWNLERCYRINHIERGTLLRTRYEPGESGTGGVPIVHLERTSEETMAEDKPGSFASFLARTPKREPKVRTSPVKEHLTIEQAKELIRLLQEVFRFLAQFRKEHPLAEKIQNPKAPPGLSEPLALHLLRSKAVIINELKGSKFDFGGKGEADVVAVTSSGTGCGVAVKGTGATDWAGITENDRSARYLLWIRFQRLFAEPDYGKFEACWVKNPGRYLRKTEKSIVFPKFEERARRDLVRKAISINTL